MASTENTGLVPGREARNTLINAARGHTRHMARWRNSATKNRRRLGTPITNLLSNMTQEGQFSLWEISSPEMQVDNVYLRHTLEKVFISAYQHHVWSYAWKLNPLNCIYSQLVQLSNNSPPPLSPPSMAFPAHWPLYLSLFPSVSFPSYWPLYLFLIPYQTSSAQYLFLHLPVR